MQYRPTVHVSGSFALFNSNLKVGQWFITDMRERGQFMGQTANGDVVVRWQVSGKFKTDDAHANGALRRFAKIYGAK